MSDNLKLASPIYWPAWLGLGILWCITKLPYSWQFAMGKGIGRIIYLLPGKLKEITRTNIQLCFPDLSPDEQTILIKKNFANLGIGIIEAAMSWWLPDHKLQNLFLVSGTDHLEAAWAKNKGIILLSPHFTCIELAGRILGFQYTFAVMYQPHKKPLIKFIHEKFRKKHYLRYIANHRLREVLRALSENMALWYAYDIDAGSKNNVFAPFFGIQTSSLTSVTRLVNLSGATILPIGFYRDENKFSYEIKLYPAIENFPGDNLVEDATRLNAAIESLIREKPEQYVWQYKRFKTRPPGEKRFY